MKFNIFLLLSLILPFLYTFEATYQKKKNHQKH